MEMLPRWPLGPGERCPSSSARPGSAPASTRTGLTTASLAARGEKLVRRNSAKRRRHQRGCCCSAKEARGSEGYVLLDRRYSRAKGRKKFLKLRNRPPRTHVASYVGYPT